MVRLIKLGLGNGSKDDKTEKNKKAFKSGWELIDKHSKVSQVKFRHPFILGIRLETYKETGDKATVSYYSVVTEKYAILPKDHIKSFRLFGNIAKGLAYLHSKSKVHLQHRLRVHLTCRLNKVHCLSKRPSQDRPLLSSAS